MPSRKPALRALLLALPTLLAGCTTMTAFGGMTPSQKAAATTALNSTISPRTAVRHVACTSFAPITWSRLDTPETIDQVKQHNAAFTKLCP